MLELSNLSLNIFSIGVPVGARFGDEDLDLTIVKINGEDSVLDWKAVCGVEDIADSVSISETTVGDVSMNLAVNLISNSYKELATSKGVNLVVNPFLRKGIVNNILSLSGSVDHLSEFKHVRSAVEIAP